MKTKDVVMILFLPVILASCLHHPLSKPDGDSAPKMPAAYPAQVSPPGVAAKQNTAVVRSSKKGKNLAPVVIEKPEQQKEPEPAGFNSAVGAFPEKTFQQIRIPAYKDTLIRLSEGTTLKIPANAFIYKSDKTPVRANLVLEAEEFYRNSDIILAGLSTRTEKEILETGGMLYLRAKAGDQECVTAPGTSIEIGFAGVSDRENMELFYGFPDPDGKIIWEPANNKSADPPSEIFTVVEEQPEFPGGDDARVEYIIKNIRYPQQALELGIQGKVFVTFVVEKDGSVTNVAVRRGIGGGCDEEAIRVVKTMPKWIPGKQRGNPVRVQYNLPVGFEFEEPLSQKSGERNTGSGKGRAYSRENGNDNAYSLVLRSSRLGWLNCDRLLLYAMNNGVNLTLEPEDAASDYVVMVFHRIRVILSPSYKIKSRVTFERIPKNESITLVTIRKKEGKLFLSMKEGTTGGSFREEKGFMEVTAAELLRELKKLDR